MVFETPCYIHNYVNLSSGTNPKAKIINSYDLLALKVHTNSTLEYKGGHKDKQANIQESLFE